MTNCAVSDLTERNKFFFFSGFLPGIGFSGHVDNCLNRCFILLIRALQFGDKLGTDLYDSGHECQVALPLAQYTYVFVFHHNLHYRN
jgi:hypothetical protein